VQFGIGAHATQLVALVAGSTYSEKPCAHVAHAHAFGAYCVQLLTGAQAAQLVVTPSSPSTSAYALAHSAHAQSPSAVMSSWLAQPSIGAQDVHMHVASGCSAQFGYGAHCAHVHAFVSCSWHPVMTLVHAVVVVVVVVVVREEVL
jgi:hypothetical protein